jgi:hypothetical protein
VQKAMVDVLAGTLEFPRISGQWFS